MTSEVYVNEHAVNFRNNKLNLFHVDATITIYQVIINKTTTLKTFSTSASSARRQIVGAVARRLKKVGGGGVPKMSAAAARRGQRTALGTSIGIG